MELGSGLVMVLGSGLVMVLGKALGMELGMALDWASGADASDDVASLVLSHQEYHQAENRQQEPGARLYSS